MKSHPLTGTAGAVPHFELSSALWAALSFPEVRATLDALAQCGELALPYEGMTLRYNAEEMAVAPGWGKAHRHSDVTSVFLTAFYGERKVRYTPGDNGTTAFMTNVTVLVEQTIEGKTDTFYLDTETGWVLLLDGREVKGYGEPEVLTYWRNSCNYAARMLIAALATKNVVKSTAVNKRAMRGHGSGTKFRAANGMIRTSFTTLDVPEEYTTTGKRVKFHLRRGHYHRFRTGKNFEGPLICKYLPAMLVNKDLQSGPLVQPEYEVAP